MTFLRFLPTRTRGAMLTALSLGWPVGQQAAVITLSVEWWVKCWKVRMYVEVGSISNSFRAICLAVSSKFSYSNRSIGLQKAWNLISRIWWLAVQLSFLGQPTTWSTSSVYTQFGAYRYWCRTWYLHLLFELFSLRLAEATRAPSHCHAAAGHRDQIHPRISQVFGR